MLHPADWKKMTPDEQQRAVYNGDADSGIHWKIVRVAELTGLDPSELEEHLEIHRGWESHDPGYLHAIIVSASEMLEYLCEHCGTQIIKGWEIFNGKLIAPWIHTTGYYTCPSGGLMLLAKPKARN